MMNNFMNGMFGKIGSGMCKLSMSGNIAVKWCFTPTSIGTIGEVICSCGEKFIFQDL